MLLQVKHISYALSQSSKVFRPTCRAYRSVVLLPYEVSLISAFAFLLFLFSVFLVVKRVLLQICTIVLKFVCLFIFY